MTFALKSKIHITDLLCTSFIILAIFLCFNTLILAPPNLAIGGDVAYIFDYYATVLRKGILDQWQIPLWDPNHFGGVPYLGHLQTQIFYISTPIILLSPSEILGVRYSIFFHIVLSGLLMYYAMLVFKFRKPFAMLSGVVYAISGTLIGKVMIGHLTIIYGYAWIPLALAFCKKALEKRKAVYAIGVGASLAMQILAASSSILLFYYTFLLIVLFLFWNVIVDFTTRNGKAKTRLLMALKIVLVSSTTAIGFSAVQLVPLLEFSNYIPRFFSLEESSITAIPNVSTLIRLFMDKSIYYNFDVVIFGAYIGLPLFILSVSALLLGRRNRKYQFILFATVIFSLIVIGSNSPLNLYAMLYRIVPFFELTHSPVRALPILVFLLCFATGAGASEIYREARKIRNKKLRIFSAWLLILLAGWGVSDLLSFASFKTLEVWDPPPSYPTSLNPHDLSASLIEYPSRIFAARGRDMHISFTVKNIGDTIWLRSSGRTDEHGSVYFMLNIRPGREITLELPKDVYPGEEVTIEHEIRLPSKAGNYSFEVGLNDYGVRWFTNPLEVPVTDIVIYNQTDVRDLMFISREKIILSNSYLTHTMNLAPSTSESSFRIYSQNVYNLPEAAAAKRNLQLAWGVGSFFYLTSYSVFLSEASGDPQMGLLELEEWSPKMWGMLNIKYIIPDKPVNATRLKPVGTPLVLLYENTFYLPRAFTVDNAILLVGYDVNSRNDVKLVIDEVVKKTEFNPTRVVLISSQKPSIDDYDLKSLQQFRGVVLLNLHTKNITRALNLLERYKDQGGRVFLVDTINKTNLEGLYTPMSEIDEFLSELESQDSAIVTVTRHTPNEIEVRVESANQASFLIVNENFYPGWKTYVDGVEADTLIGNIVARAVYLDRPGEHKITLKYVPTSYVVGLLVTLLTITVILMYMFLRRYSRKLGLLQQIFRGRSPC